jgi:hypothetical protein
MARSQKEVPARRGRPAKFAEPRINLSFRLQRSIYDEVKAVAHDAGLSISEEIERRLRHIADWEEAFGTARKLVETHEEVTAAGFEAALRYKGYQPVTTDQGVIWLSPGMPLTKISASINAAAVANAMLPELTGVIVRAIEKVTKEGDGNG